MNLRLRRRQTSDRARFSAGSRSYYLRPAPNRPRIGPEASTRLIQRDRKQALPYAAHRTAVLDAQNANRRTVSSRVLAKEVAEGAVAACPRFWPRVPRTITPTSTVSAPTSSLSQRTNLSLQVAARTSHK